ncbi:MAG: MoxR family ATPase [Oligoflexia bacterium]|nr:MoxR family ATPase [Oligoflexia bacterium]
MRVESADRDAEPLVAAGELLTRLATRVQQVVRGKDDVVELCIVAIIAGGHVLLEDVPGVGKTTLAMALADAMGGSFRRIQHTSDLLPGDITGVNILAPDGTSFSFRPGPLFANVVLADEINRATPKTQSALLEAMNERRVTVDGVSHVLPAPFTVLATQNPHDYHGTFPLPDSQLDRFLIRLTMGYPDREHEREILRRGTAHPVPLLPALGPDKILGLARAVDQVRVHPDVEDYILELVRRTRGDARFVRGASTRGAEALYRACRALALVRDRSFVIPEDVRALAVAVLAHRVLPRAETGRPGQAARTAVRELLWELPPPG